MVISFPGMDTYKEVFVALKGDRWLERGIAVLALDGPGQAECRVLGITVSMENWTAVGKAAVDWLMARPEIDPQQDRRVRQQLRLVLRHHRHGERAAHLRLRRQLQQSRARLPRDLRGGEPDLQEALHVHGGLHRRGKFDAFRRTLTWEGHAEKIRVPYLCVAGEWDELSPMVHTERMLEDMSNPRRLWCIRMPATPSAPARRSTSGRIRRRWWPTGWRRALPASRWRASAGMSTTAAR